MAEFLNFERDEVPGLRIPSGGFQRDADVIHESISARGRCPPTTLISLSELPLELYNRIYEDQRRDFPFGEEADEGARIVHLKKEDDGAFAIHTLYEDGGFSGHVIVEKGDPGFEWCQTLNRSQEEADADWKRYRLWKISHISAKALQSEDFTEIGAALGTIQEIVLPA
jgi:hypothetical protein